MDNIISRKGRALKIIEEQKQKINSMEAGRKKQNALKKLKQMEEDFQDKYVLMRPTREFREFRVRPEAEERRKAESEDNAILNESTTKAKESLVDDDLRELYKMIKQAEKKSDEEMNAFYDRVGRACSIMKEEIPPAEAEKK